MATKSVVCTSDVFMEAAPKHYRIEYLQLWRLKGRVNRERNRIKRPLPHLCYL